jgi:hypothetical protein
VRVGVGDPDGADSATGPMLSSVSVEPPADRISGRPRVVPQASGAVRRDGLNAIRGRERVELTNLGPGARAWFGMIIRCCSLSCMRSCGWSSRLRSWRVG